MVLQRRQAHAGDGIPAELKFDGFDRRGAPAFAACGYRRDLIQPPLRGLVRWR